MAEVVLTKQRIEDGKTERLIEWMSEVREREDEVVETFRSEGMLTETAFLERTDDGDYLVYFMEAQDFDDVYEAYDDSTHDIDEEHKKVLEEVLKDGDSPGVESYELLYHMTSPDRS